jgi:hypothetical protein
MRGTHGLSSAERETIQDSEQKPTSEGHSPTVERRTRYWSGQRKNASQRGALTVCRAQSKGLIRTAKEASQRRTLTVCRAKSEGLVRTTKEGQPARVTHILSSAERRIGQDNEGKPASEGHLPTVEHRARDWSGQQKRASQ